MIQCIDFDGNIVNEEFIPKELRGLDRFEARKIVIDLLDDANLLEKVEDHEIQIPKGDRSKTILEPMVSDQWFVKTEKLAKDAIRVVEDKDIKFIPKNWEKTYFEWMYNIQDWCVSRQQWWGHRIPAWYDSSNNVYVGLSEEDVRKKYKLDEEINLVQDEDVLDTWFSSWLWPISVFNGVLEPDNPEINYYYPTQDLITGPDILFFWVARMIMSGYELRDQHPFSNVYLTGLVRDKLGRKMSKQLGNSPDALGLIDNYGADAVRVGLMLSSAAGNDLLFDESLCQQGKNFSNKIWNAYRLIDGFEVAESQIIPTLNASAIKWYQSIFAQTLIKVEDHFNKYRISDALMTLYKLIWDDF